MCKAWEDNYKSGVALGRNEGIELGRAEGIAQVIIAIYTNGIDANTISKLTNIELHKVKEIINKNSKNPIN